MATLQHMGMLIFIASFAFFFGSSSGLVMIGAACTVFALRPDRRRVLRYCCAHDPGIPRQDAGGQVLRVYARFACVGQGRALEEL